MSEHFIAFWNVENLFDIETSTNRPAYLQKKLKKELKGWTDAILNRKLDQIASIITQMNGGQGPDILGVCEVENLAVMNRLADVISSGGRTYGVAHADTSDGRGIDVAFLYDQTRYQSAEQFQHFVQKRTATRDIFQVNLKTSSNRDLVVIGNHWPSRRGGQFQSEPYRMMVGETLAYFHDRIIEEKGEDTAIVVMGDFNDEPFDRSVRDYALAIRERRKIMGSRSKNYFYNLMWEIAGARTATHYFSGVPNVLDQFWISKGILKTGTDFRIKSGSVTVEDFPELVASGTYPRPRPFSRPSKKGGHDPDGFSDHFPISMVLIEAD